MESTRLVLKTVMSLYFSGLTCCFNRKITSILTSPVFRFVQTFEVKCEKDGLCA